MQYLRIGFIKINVSTVETDVKVYTEDEITTVQTVTEAGGNYVYDNAVSDNGEVIVGSIYDIIKIKEREERR